MLWTLLCWQSERGPREATRDASRAADVLGVDLGVGAVTAMKDGAATAVNQKRLRIRKIDRKFPANSDQVSPQDLINCKSIANLNDRGRADACCYSAGRIRFASTFAL